MNNKSFTYQSITELSKLLKNKIISPVELTNHFLSKLENEGSDYNAVAHINRSSAITQAKEAEASIMKKKISWQITWNSICSKRFTFYK